VTPGTRVRETRRDAKREPAITPAAIALVAALVMIAGCRAEAPAGPVRSPEGSADATRSAATPVDPVPATTGADASVPVVETTADAPPAATDATAGEKAASEADPDETRPPVPAQDPPAASAPGGPALSPAVMLLSAFNLPDDWLSIDRERFEASLARWFPAERSPALSSASLQALGRALDRDDEGAVRAALVLARSRDPEARETLLVHLERRIERPAARGGNATEVVAAAAFDPVLVPPPPERPRVPGVEPPRPSGIRLEQLSTGSRPHPDLEVRVECACSALALGRDGVIPFLLRILREGTTAATATPEGKEFADPSWAQSRAAAALSRRAGIPLAYAPEASVAERETEAARLEQRLPKPKKPKR
jgi:hypothetical protein